MSTVCRIVSSERVRSFTLDLLEKPGSGIGPEKIGAARRNAENLSRLLDRESREIAKLDELGGLRVSHSEFDQGIVQCKDVVIHLGRGDFDSVEINARPAAAMLGPALAARILDEDPAHRLGSSGKEVAAAVPVLGFVYFYQPQIGFVD